MPIPPFGASRLKLKRAVHHIASLDLLSQDYSSRAVLTPYEADRKGVMILHRYRWSEPLPCDVPSIIGDALHNIRSALDLMLCDVARMQGKSPSMMRYPFAMDVHALRDRLKEKPYPKLGNDINAAIIATKPFKQGGDSALRGLHDLDVLDKHETLLLVSEVIPKAMRFIDGQLSDPPPNQQWMSASFSEAATAWTNADMPVYTPTPVRGQVRLFFGPGLPLSGEPVLETLNACLKVSTEIIESFAAKFGSGNLQTGSAP